MTSSGRPPSTPEELAARARAGSADAFAGLVERFQGPLHQFLCLRLRSAADAESVAQEAFVRAWQKIDRYDDRWRFSTWLFTIASRMASSHVRSEARRAAGPVPAELEGSAPDPALATQCREESENLWDLVERAVGTEQRSALWLRYAEDLSPAEIGKVLGRTGPSVRVLLFRARRTLEHLLRQRAAAVADAEPVPPSSTSTSEATIIPLIAPTPAVAPTDLTPPAGWTSRSVAGGS